MFSLKVFFQSPTRNCKPGVLKRAREASDDTLHRLAEDAKAKVVENLESEAEERDEVDVDM